MMELPLILMAGILGSSHCVGMCGPIAITLGTASSGRLSGLWRQLVFSMGRVFTYLTLGTLAGAGGRWLVQSGSGLIFVSALLSVVAGCVLTYQGMRSVGLIKFRRRIGDVLPCLATGGISSLLTAPGTVAPLIAGVFTGFLPCGLLYGMLALAASKSNPWQGALIMTVFGVGTIPLLVVMGCLGQVLDHAARRKILKLAAWCLLLTGVLTVVRGIAFAFPAEKQEAPDCPFCTAELRESK